MWNWRPSWIFHVFRSFTHKIMVCHAVLCVYLIPWPRKYRLRPQNHDPTWSNFRDIGNLRFWGGHFEKWPKLVVSPSFFSGNIANMISEGPLNKMVPLTGDHGGGVHGDPVTSRTMSFVMVCSWLYILWHGSVIHWYCGNRCPSTHRTTLKNMFKSLNKNNY